MSAIDRTCPACNASPGDPCVDLRGGNRILGSVHAARRRGPVGVNRPTMIPEPNRPTDDLESEPRP